MSSYKEQIEHMEILFSKDSDTPWKDYSRSRKWAKKQMNRYMRRLNKKIQPDDGGRKTGRKPNDGWEW